jgi:high frequency lysogenization protein
VKVNNAQTMCLAATLQCCISIQRLARHGATDENMLTRMVATVLDFSTVEPEKLYGGAQTLKTGLKFIQDSGPGQMDSDRVEVLSLTNAVQQIQKVLVNTPVIQNSLGEKLNYLHSQELGFPYSNDSWEKFNQIYIKTLGTLEPKIIVKGEQNWLQNPLTVAKIRSGLLAAVRSAYFWNSLGGKRWHLLLLRKQYINNARTLLTNLA